MPFERNPKEKQSLIMSSKKDQNNLLETIFKSKDSLDKDGIEVDERELEKDEDMKELMKMKGPSGSHKMRSFTGGADDYF